MFAARLAPFESRSRFSAEREVAAAAHRFTLNFGGLTRGEGGGRNRAFLQEEGSPRLPPVFSACRDVDATCWILIRIAFPGIAFPSLDFRLDLHDLTPFRRNRRSARTERHPLRWQGCGAEGDIGIQAKKAADINPPPSAAHHARSRPTGLEPATSGVPRPRVAGMREGVDLQRSYGSISHGTSHVRSSPRAFRIS